MVSHYTEQGLTWLAFLKIKFKTRYQVTNSLMKALYIEIERESIHQTEGKT